MTRWREALISLILFVVVAFPTSVQAGKKPGGATHVLVLDGVTCGQVASCEGGAMAAEVIKEAGGTESIVRKRLGKVVCEPATLSLVGVPDKAVADWIASTWQGKPQHKSGHVSFLDHE